MRTGLQDVTNASELPSSPARKRSRQETEEDDACLIKLAQTTVQSTHVTQPEAFKASSVPHQRGGTHRSIRHGRLGLSMPTVTPGKICHNYKC